MTSGACSASLSEGAMPSGNDAGAGSDTLTRFAAALRRESHHLLGCPGLLWQQLHNRLQWAGGDAADMLYAERVARTEEGARPWVRVRTRFVECEALVESLNFPCSKCAVSPDGSFVVSAAGNQLIVHDMQSGVPRARFTGHAAAIFGFDVNPLGDRIVSGAEDGTLKVWDAASGTELANLRGHTSIVRCCSFSPDGSFVVSAGGKLEDWREFDEIETRARRGTLSPDRRRWLDGERDTAERKALLATAVMIWNAETADPIGTLTGMRQSIFACSVGPDAEVLVTASGQTATIWDLSSMSVRATLVGHDGGVMDCAISADGRRIVTASTDNTLKVWDARGGRELLTLRGHDSWVNACTFSPDGSLIVSGAADATLKIWDATDGTEKTTLRGHGGRVTDCAFTADGSSLLSVSVDNTLKIWDVETAKSSPVQRIEPTHADNCAISADARTVVAASDARIEHAGVVSPTCEITVLRPDTGELEVLRPGTTASPSACAFSSDGRFFVTHGSVFDARTCEKGVDLHDYSGHSVAISPDASYVVSAGSDKQVRMWDTHTGSMLRELEGHTTDIIILALSPDGTFIASAGDKSLWVWDPRTGRGRTVRTAHSSEIVTCAVSPDASFLVTTARAVKVWDTRPLRERFTAAEYEKGIFACAISPAGDLIATGGSEGTLQFWDASTGRQKGVCRGHVAHVAACAFTPDGELLVSAGGDGWLRVWRVVDLLEVANVPLPAGLWGFEGSGQPSSRLTLSSLRPRIACVDSAHNVHVLDLEGLSYGPRIVTACRRGRKRSVRCPCAAQSR